MNAGMSQAAVASTPAPSSPAWHMLYQAALFETDRAKILARISEAEQAILLRMRELFVIPTDHIEEDVVLDDALYGLRALRNCVHSEIAVA